MSLFFHTRVCTGPARPAAEGLIRLKEKKSDFKTPSIGEKGSLFFPPLLLLSCVFASCETRVNFHSEWL